MDSADGLPILLRISVFYFLVFLPLFSCWFRALDYADLCQILSTH